MPILLVLVLVVGLFLYSQKPATTHTAAPTSPTQPGKPGGSAAADAKTVADIITEISAEARGWVQSFSTNAGPNDTANSDSGTDDTV